MIDWFARNTVASKKQYPLVYICICLQSSILEKHLVRYKIPHMLYAIAAYPYFGCKASMNNASRDNKVLKELWMTTYHTWLFSVRFVKDGWSRYVKLRRSDASVSTDGELLPSSHNVVSLYACGYPSDQTCGLRIPAAWAFFGGACAVMVESEIGLMVDGILYLVVLKSAQICTLSMFPSSCELSAGLPSTITMASLKLYNANQQRDRDTLEPRRSW